MGIAHYHTKLLLNKQVFKVLATAEFLSKHSYNVAKGFNFLPDRPNEEDYKIAKSYANILYEKIFNNDLQEISIDKTENTDMILQRKQS